MNSFVLTKYLSQCVLFCFLSSISAFSFAQDKPFAIAIHGGAGTIEKKRFTPEKEQAYRAKLKEAVESGYAVLKKGGTSIDAVVMAITILEQSPYFNAAKGAVYT
ncbi:MAG: isoaspartyl peptidase/L-asparaginase, partial [Colwellia sp.]|nr:isoaspartyl peptidase/L-asparaginase [Colwellia sp.]